MAEARTATLRFPLFALMSPDSGLTLVLNRNGQPPVLPLFSEWDWAADFARRHLPVMVPSKPLLSDELVDLIKLAPWLSAPSGIAIDLVDLTTEGVHTITIESFIRNLANAEN